MTNPQGEPSRDGGDPNFDAFGATPLPLDQLTAVIEVEFDDLSVLREAFIHRSYVNELADPTSLVDNERLELLGDSVLSFVVIDELFRRFPKEQEGELTRLRSALVRK